MAFMSVVIASRVTVQQVQGREGQSYVGTGNKGNATNSRGNNAGGQVRVVKCYNCQGEGHMERKCTKPKRPRNSAWFQEKLLLVQAQESGHVLDEEQLASLTNPGIPDRQVAQTTIPNNAVLMANLSNYGSKVISEVPHSEPYHNDIDNQSVHAIQDFEQTPIVDFPKNEITNFGKHFILQQELSAEQAFLLQTYNPNIEQSDISPVRIEAPSELPKDKSCDNQNALEIPEYFENNDLKAQLQAKDTTIRKLKEHIKSMRENVKKDKVKQDVDETETINIELEHSVAKLLSENELLHKEIRHLKKIYKDQFDSIKKTRACSKEHSDSLIAQLNSKSMENANLKSKIQEKFFVATTLQNELKRLKGLKSSTSTSRSKPSGNTKNNRILQTSNSNMKNKVEDHPRSVISRSNKMNRNVEPICNVDVKHSMLNANSKLIYATCNKCMFDAIHDMCVLDFVKDVNVHSKSAKNNKKQNIWKPIGKVFTEIGYKWKPTGRTFTLAGHLFPLTRITSIKVVPLKETTSHLVKTQKPEFKIYSRRSKLVKVVGSSKKYKIVESRIANNSEPNHSWGSNATDVPSSSSLINDRSKDTNLYIISLDDMLKTSPICLLSKASKTKSWLWYRRLSHLNFGTLNQLAKYGLARGIPKIKFKKDHLCSACALGKIKKSSHQPKAKDTNQEKLYLLHMDLCGLMRVESINGKSISW
ncbi:retrovirus-related pol polyprotein from transposon TNT 1-94 [Tanacetum coccineum]